MSTVPPYAIPTFATPSSGSWPSASDWASLNSSVGARLQTLRPWAAVCYLSDPLYDVDQCQSVLAGYTNDTQREAVPAALLWANWESCGSIDEGCALDYINPQPVANAACNQGSTPLYSVSIRDAQDASTIVQWATTHDVKLTVKNTGHDYLGRSAAPSTLQVHTHQLNNLNYVPEFVPQGSDASSVPALTMGAGAQIHNIYDYAAEQNITPVIGACLTVGAAGGYIQGGGHGVLTPAYGLAVDSALEFEIVTADGKIRVANEAQNSDLFWALRGGGAGSWGIVTSVTIKVYPQVAIGGSLLTIQPNVTQNATALGIEFLALVASYQNAWLRKGIANTFVISPTEYFVSLYWPTTTGSVSDLYTFYDALNTLSPTYTVTANVTSLFPSVSAVNIDQIGPSFESISFFGAASQLSSRLVPKSFLDDATSIYAVAEAIWRGFEIVNAPWASVQNVLLPALPFLILGNMPSQTGAAGEGNATGANPGLYAAAWHVVYTTPWTTEVNATMNAAVTSAIHDAVAPLTALGIQSAYQNEGDAFEVDWQEAFFGYKYSTLSSIKQKYDPQNFFTTYKGVASVTDLAAYKCYANKQDEF